MRPPDALPWSAAAAPIWAMVSGYPSPYRLNKPLAFIHAYIDDSASEVGKRRLFMAGYLTRSETWALFSDAWRDELKAAPAIEYLKMKEAQNLSGQFDGWDREDVDEKLKGFARVIRHFHPQSFEFTIDREDYGRIVSPVAPRGLANPYFPCSLSAMSGIARYLESEGINIPIRFIFDRQDGVSDDIRLAFDWFCSQLPKRARELISGEPHFEDDKMVMPLQAADLIAWHLRREYDDCGGERNLPMADTLRADKHLYIHIEEPYLHKWAKDFAPMTPIISELQSKRQWRGAKQEIRALSNAGFIPPYGTRWKNFRARIADWFRR